MTELRPIASNSLIAAAACPSMFKAERVFGAGTKDSWLSKLPMRLRRAGDR